MPEQRRVTQLVHYKPRLEDKYQKDRTAKTEALKWRKVNWLLSEHSYHSLQQSKIHSHTGTQ